MICNNNTNNDHAATHANTKKISLCTSVALRAAEPDLPLKLKRGPNKGRAQQQTKIIYMGQGVNENC